MGERFFVRQINILTGHVSRLSSELKKKRWKSRKGILLLITPEVSDIEYGLSSVVLAPHFSKTICLFSRITLEEFVDQKVSVCLYTELG